MDIANVMSSLAGIHNGLIEISVKGEDVLRLAKVIRDIRALVFKLEKEGERESGKQTDGTGNE